MPLLGGECVPVASRVGFHPVVAGFPLRPFPVFCLLEADDLPVGSVAQGLQIGVGFFHAATGFLCLDPVVVGVVPAFFPGEVDHEVDMVVPSLG